MIFDVLHYNYADRIGNLQVGSLGLLGSDPNVVNLDFCVD